MKKLKKGSLEAKRFMAKIRAMRKSSPKKSKKISGSSHKDTKSHNVNIRVLSGKIADLTASDFTKINRDVNGNPRYVFPWWRIADTYDQALKYAKKFGGKKFHNKQYGGGIVIQSYNISEDAKRINEIVNSKIGSVKKKTKKSPVKKAKKVNVKEYLKKRGLRMPHGYETTKRVRITGTPPYKNPDAVREIQLYADNNSQLYFSRKLPILKNLQKKYKKGTFDVNKASKLWRYYIDDAMQRYHKEFGNRGKWYDMINTTDRQLLANEYAEDTLNEFEMGNFVS